MKDNVIKWHMYMYVIYIQRYTWFTLTIYYAIVKNEEKNELWIFRTHQKSSRWCCESLKRKKNIPMSFCLRRWWKIENIEHNWKKLVSKIKFSRETGATQNSNIKNKSSNEVRRGAARRGAVRRTELKSTTHIMWKYSNLTAYGEFLETICKAKPVAAHKIQRENTTN